MGILGCTSLPPHRPHRRWRTDAPPGRCTLSTDRRSLPSIAIEHRLCSHQWVLVQKRWSDEAATELLSVRESREYVDERLAHPPFWLMKLLFVVGTLAAVAASVAVGLQMSNRSAVTARVVDALRGGDCLTWPPGAPERATQVDCTDEHLFEVADSEATQISSAPGDPAAEVARQKTCAQAVARYLGPRYDPGGRFVVGDVWTPGRVLCGLQLPSDGIASVGFKGRVGDQDQSSVWPAGTCLGIRDSQTTEVAVDCALPHALEITGTVDLSTVFDQAAPSIAAQDAVVHDACGAATSAYLSPATLDATSLALRYQPIDPAGWAAGSRRIACRIGSPKPDGGWATLVGGAKTGVVVDGQPPVALPSPAEPPPADAPAPVSEEPQPSPQIEQPVSVSPQTDGSTAVTASVAPHLVGTEAPGPPPESLPVEPLPASGPPPPG